MKKSAGRPADAVELRRRAERRLHGQRPEGGARRAESEAARLVHELEVHQIELEMQNEELQQAHTVMEALLAQYTDLYDFAPTGYFSLDHEGAICRVNLSGARLLGVERLHLMKRRFGTFVAESDRPAFSAFLQNVFAGPGKECCEVVLPKEGHHPLFVRIEGVVSEDGQECRAVMLDLSERKRVELEHAQLAAIVESSNDAILIRGPDSTILSWNAAAERLFGWSAQEAVGQSTDLIVLPEHIGKLRGIIERAARGEPVSPVETTNLRKDGARILTQITFSPIRNGQGNVVAHSFTVRDMTELKRNEDALRSYAARLRKLSRRLQEVEATERNAISRELHDRIGQGLSTLSLMVGTLGARLPEGARSAAQTQLKDIQALLRSVVANVRDVMAELRPPALDDYGLLAALRHFMTGFSKRTGIAVNLSGVDLDPRLPLVVETAIYRISEEALNNIAKHAHAKKVKISLNAVADRIVLDIADDGVGFDASNRPDGKEHWGMITMRERAEAVGVTFRLKSAPGTGTRIVLEAERAAT